MKKVSVVVCVYNRCDFIEKCLDSILSQDFADYEIIVVDDGSSDGTYQILERFRNEHGIKVRRNEKNLGVSKSRNIGAMEAEGEIVAYTDSDCIVDKSWLKELTKPFQMDGGIVISGGEVLDGDTSKYWTLVTKGIDFIAYETGYVDRIVGCNMAIKKEFLLKNGFDDTLKYGADETDLCMRARKKGLKVFFQKSAYVRHFHRISFMALLKQRFLIGKGNCYFRLKYSVVPSISVKSVIFLFLLLSLCFRAAGASLFFAGAYALIIFYEDTRHGRKSFKELLITFPGRLFMLTMESCGYLMGVLSFLRLFIKKK